MYDLFIFDLDGTLIDSIGDIADALNAALAEVGRRPRSDEEVARMVGRGVHELVANALGGNVEDRGLIERIAVSYRSKYAAQPVRRTTPYLGVRETLAQLPGKKAVATNKPGGLARTILDRLELASQFVAILGEDDVPERKPDPVMVDLIRGKVGATRQRTLFVGDSLVDAATADAARVPLALVSYGYEDTAAIAARPARYHLERFADLLKVVAQEH